MRALRILFVCFAAVLFSTSAFVPESFPWGSIKEFGISFETHQFIIKKAYELLEKDPAFDPQKFPSFDQILAYEGKGQGPDTDGLTMYSEHYYNPKLQEGKAPASAGKYFSRLAMAVAEGKADEAAKPAAWSAHFMADMRVPFHIIGCSYEHIKRVFDQSGDNPIPLDEKFYGSQSMAIDTASETKDFKPEIEKTYLPAAEKSSYLDWFDPWYWNGGYGYYMENSSHIHWEGLLLHPGEYDLTAFDPNWKNPALNADDKDEVTAAKLAESATNAAKKAASETAARLDYYMNNDDPAINLAIRSVYTMWRSTMSGLKPFTSIVDKNGVYIVSGFVKNASTETAKNVRLKIKVEGGELLPGSKEVQAIGDIPAGKQLLKSPTWKVKPGKGKCKVTVTAYGTYENTPDIGYNSVKEELKGTGDEGFLFYEGTTGELAQTVDNYIMGLSKGDIKVENREWDKYDHNDESIEDALYRKSFVFQKVAGYRKDGAPEWKWLGDAQIELTVTKRAYTSSMNKSVQGEMREQINRRSAEYDQFRFVSQFAQNVQFGNYYNRGGAKVIENNIPEKLLPDNLLKNYENKYDQATGIWSMNVDVPRKLHGSYHIFYVDAVNDNNKFKELYASAANVQIRVRVSTANGMEGQSGLPDPKAILYVILKKLPFEGDDFPVAPPAGQ